MRVVHEVQFRVDALVANLNRVMESCKAVKLVEPEGISARDPLVAIGIV